VVQRAISGTGQAFAFATCAAGKLSLAGGLDGSDGWTPCEREKPEKAGKSNHIDPEMPFAEFFIPPRRDFSLAERWCSPHESLQCATAPSIGDHFMPFNTVF
jgi:hypothetical protein